MFFRIAGNSDPHVGIGLPYEFHQLIRIAETSVRSAKRLLTGRRVAAQGHHILNALRGSQRKPVLQFIARCAHTGEMRHRSALKIRLNLPAPLQRPVLCRTASAVRTRDERRFIINQRPQIAAQRSITIRCLWRKDLD